MPKFQKRQSPRIKSTPTKKEISTPTKKITSNTKKTRFNVSPILEEKTSTPTKKQVKKQTKKPAKDIQNEVFNKSEKHISFSEIDISPVKVTSTNNLLDQFFLIEAQVKNQIDQIEEPSRELKDLSFIRTSSKPNGNDAGIISSTPAKTSSKKELEEFLSALDNDISGIEDTINPSNEDFDIESFKEIGTSNKRSSARLRSQAKNQNDNHLTPSKKFKLNKDADSPLKSKNVNKIQKGQNIKGSSDKKPIKKRVGRTSKKINISDEKLELIQKQREDLYKRLENFKLTEEIL